MHKIFLVTILIIIIFAASLACAEPTKASQSIYENDIKKANTSKDLNNADLAWHALNTYGYDCEEVLNKGKTNNDGYFIITCGNGKKLRVYLRNGQHPKITKIDGKY